MRSLVRSLKPFIVILAVDHDDGFVDNYSASPN